MFVRRAGPTILHADLDSFYASVEQRDDPALRGRPVIVGGGVVLAASYEAKACGVRTAMGGRLRRGSYAREAVGRAAADVTAYSRGEQGGVRDLRATPRRSSRRCRSTRRSSTCAGSAHLRQPDRDRARLRAEVRERGRAADHRRAGLHEVPGQGRERVAKPDGLLVIPAGGELAFLHPLPVERLWGVGRVTAAKLHEQGLTTVGQVAALGELALVEMLGRAVRAPAPRAGPQPRPAAGAHAPAAAVDRRAAGTRPAGARAGRDPGGADDAVDRVARRLRAARRACRTVVLRLRFDDFSRATRSHTIAEATTRTATLLAVARGLLARPSR